MPHIHKASILKMEQAAVFVLTKAGSPCVVAFQVKVIPQYCIAHPILHIILHVISVCTPRKWWLFFLASFCDVIIVTARSLHARNKLNSCQLKLQTVIKLFFEVDQVHHSLVIHRMPSPDFLCSHEM